MIKARLTRDGKDVILLGLSFENLSRLREGQPIMVRGEEVGLNMDVVIHAEKDEQTIIESMRASGMQVPEPTVPESKCPDDGTPLLMTESLHTGKVEAHCTQCGRKFGVLQ